MKLKLLNISIYADRAQWEIYTFGFVRIKKFTAMNSKAKSGCYMELTTVDEFPVLRVHERGKDDKTITFDIKLKKIDDRYAFMDGELANFEAGMKNVISDLYPGYTVSIKFDHAFRGEINDGNTDDVSFIPISSDINKSLYLIEVFKNV